MKRRDPTLVGSERIVQLLQELPENGMTRELEQIQELFALVSDQNLMAFVQEDLRAAALARANAVQAHLWRMEYLQLLMQHIGMDGSCTDLRHREMFLALAEDKAFLDALPYRMHLEAYHLAFMIRNTPLRRQCCAA